MVPGFVQVGAIAVGAQILVIGVLYVYLRRRQPLPDSEVRRRTVVLLVTGVVLIAGGQLLALGSIGSLRVTDRFTLQQVVWLQELGLVAALVGFILVAAALVWHGRAATREAS